MLQKIFRPNERFLQRLRSTFFNKFIVKILIIKKFVPNVSEKLTSEKLDVPEVTQSQEGQKQKLRIVLGAVNRVNKILREYKGHSSGSNDALIFFFFCILVTLTRWNFASAKDSYTSFYKKFWVNSTSFICVWFA